MASLDQDVRTGHFEAAASRGNLYRLLVRLLTWPDASIDRSIGSGQLDNAIQQSLQALPYRLNWCGKATDSTPAPPASLQSEFLRLFELSVKDTPCVLYGGVYADNRRAVMEELLRYYRHFGLSVEAAPEKDLPDSIPTVLEFMQFLCLMESKAACAEEAKVPRKAQKDVLERHLTRWSPQLRERVGRMNPLPVYRNAIELFDAFCRAELSQLTANLIH